MAGTCAEPVKTLSALSAESCHHALHDLSENLKFLGRGVLNEMGVHAAYVGVGCLFQKTESLVGHDGGDAATVLRALTTKHQPFPLEAGNRVRDPAA